VDYLVANGQRHCFVIFAAADASARSGVKRKSREKFQKFRIFFIDAEDFHALARGHFRERYCALFAPKFGQAALQGYAVGTETIGAKSGEKQFLDFRRDSVLEALGFIMCPRPVQANDFGEKFFGELVTHGKVVRHAASFSRKGDAAVAPDTKQSVARQTL
jgi:hypothetical protein